MKKLSTITILCLLVFTFCLSGCKDDLKGDYIIEQEYQQIMEFLEEEESLSSFKWLVEQGVVKRQGEINVEGDRGEITLRYTSLLGSSGNYTVLAPDNDAVLAYANSLGRAKVEDMTATEIAEFLEFHIILSGIQLRGQKTGLFNSFGDTTMSGVRHFVDTRGGYTDIILNKESKVMATNDLSNGYLYVLDKALSYHPSTVYDYLKSTGRFNILASAIDACGIMNSRGVKLLPDTFGNVDQPHRHIPGQIIVPFFTFLAIPDQAFIEDGVTDVTSLLAFLREKNPTLSANDDQLIYDYIMYLNIKGQQNKHGGPGSQDYGRYTFQMALYETAYDQSGGGRRVYAQNMETLAPGYALSIYDRGTNPNVNLLQVNRTSVNTSGVVEFDAGMSDVSLKNGVIHELTRALPMENTGVESTKIIKECEDGFREYQTPSSAWVADLEDLRTNITTFCWNTVRYPGFTTSNPTGDQGHGVRFNANNADDWVEFIIRNVPPGRYNILINFKRDDGLCGNILPYFRNDKDAFSWKTDLQLSVLNMKQRNGSEFNPWPDTQQNYNIGTVLITEYGDYTIRFVHTNDQDGQYDSIVFLPVEENIDNGEDGEENEG